MLHLCTYYALFLFCKLKKKPKKQFLEKKKAYLTHKMKHPRHHYQTPLRVNRRLEMVHPMPSFHRTINQAHWARGRVSEGESSVQCQRLWETRTFGDILTCRFKIQARPLSHIQSRPQGVHVMIGRNWKLCREEAWQRCWIPSSVGAFFPPKGEPKQEWERLSE